MEDDGKIVRLWLNRRAPEKPKPYGVDAVIRSVDENSPHANWAAITCFLVISFLGFLGFVLLPTAPNGGLTWNAAISLAVGVLGGVFALCFRYVRDFWVLPRAGSHARGTRSGQAGAEEALMSDPICTRSRFARSWSKRAMEAGMSGVQILHLASDLMSKSAWALWRGMKIALGYGVPSAYTYSVLIYSNREPTKSGMRIEGDDLTPLEEHAIWGMSKGFFSGYVVRARGWGGRWRWIKDRRPHLNVH